MTQSDAPNEQLSNQEIGDLWEEYEAVMIRRWPPEEYGEDEDLSVLYSITEQFKTELLLLRDQLSKERREKEKLKELHIHQETHLNDQFEKEREMRKELVKAVLWYFECKSGMGYENALDTMEAKNSLIAKATELDKNN